MTEELYERAVELLAKVADEFERLSGIEMEVPLPDELLKAYVDAAAFAGALAELFDKDNVDGRAEAMKPVREAFTPIFRKHREAVQPFEEQDAMLPGIITVKLYERNANRYPAGEEPWPDDELIHAVGQLEEEVRRDRLLSS